MCAFAFMLSAPCDQWCVFMGSAWLLNHAGSSGPLWRTAASLELEIKFWPKGETAGHIHPSLYLIHPLSLSSPPLFPLSISLSFLLLTTSQTCVLQYTTLSLMVSPPPLFFFSPAAPSFCPVFLHFIFIPLSIRPARPRLYQPLFPPNLSPSLCFTFPPFFQWLWFFLDLHCC